MGDVRPCATTKKPKAAVVLSREEVQQVLGKLRRFHYRVCLTTIYSCGLRLSEGVHLQVVDIDSGRLLLHVRQGKGAKDRYVPLPTTTLTLLRQQWRKHHHSQWLFPSRQKATATQAMYVGGVQRAFKAAGR